MSSQTISLFSESTMEIFEEPFIYGYIDNFLPEDLYRTLEENFVQPADQPLGEALSEGKQRLQFSTPAPTDILGQNRPWNEFVSQISSSRYRKDMLDWVKSKFANSKQNDSVYSELMRKRFDIDHELTRLDCEFSILSRNALLTPHTDSPDKYISCVLYFAQEDWKSEWGGATEVYKAKKEKYQYNWLNYGLPIDLMNREASAEFERNRLFFFVKSYNSWHGVGAIQAPKNMPRRSFNFALAVPRGLSSNWDLRFGDEEIRKLEAKKFFMPRLERDAKRWLRRVLSG